LPDSIKEIYCFTNERPKSKVREIERRLDRNPLFKTVFRGSLGEKKDFRNIHPNFDPF